MILLEGEVVVTSINLIAWRNVVHNERRKVRRWQGCSDQDAVDLLAFILSSRAAPPGSERTKSQQTARRWWRWASSLEAS